MDPVRILLIQGRLDAVAPHLCHALSQAYAEGAMAAGIGWATCPPWSMERNILGIVGIVGIVPVHETLLGHVEQLGDAGVAKWTVRMRALGAMAA